MAEAHYKRDDVFGLSRDTPLNYVARPRVDENFLRNLKSQKHVVLYGGSKQGKTCLRKHCLKPEDYILIQCINNLDISNLNSSILKRAGFEITQSQTKSASGKIKANAKFNAALAGLSIEAGGEKGNEKQITTTTAPLEIDLDDVNDIINSLKSIEFKKIIVLEDFHYLPAETQKDFAFSLKAFHEISDYCFVIVGVWLEDNRLIVYNGDLTGRVISVNADIWEPDELREIIQHGGALLGITFDSTFTEQLIEHCKDSVYIVQEACRRVCQQQNIEETLDAPQEIGNNVNASELVKEIVNEQSARYSSFLTAFSDGFQDTELEMYKWLLFPILTSSVEELEQGILYRKIRQSLIENHPKRSSLNPGNITQALQSASSLQVKKDIKPIIIDYDQTNKKINIVDKGFLVWLAHQNTKELLEDIGLPSKN
ncbi:hypothetical protein ACXR8V_02445 [Pseudomonas aeruginosa]|uniref:hypothetical protein n=1 Tax=Pseudomonas aeruginosa TaxID=287 RepID=UPI000E3C3684|nr:hypothetical protein [Pseudomonas aeruginosa]MBG7107119.1 hypothetical protein [Pseudomonas aeruginosa]MCS8262073.1 hypothetical protein [Pseudomonas aeruginosa]MDY1197004.1 hypothetical protein [Pseudomonas aeruginosa]TEL72873.1 hypothetical protein IPC176_05385 [Pseudomonas aeruginosa]HBO2999160.1 hypothetical protein [Pseudomonas aeruginosa]